MPHSHAPAPEADRRWLRVAFALIAAFMGVEIAAGIVAGSLALLSDAAHMLTDAGAIGLALGASMLAARPPSGRFTFGLGRAEILSALANGAALLVLAGVIAWEAIERLGDPPDIEGALVIAVGAAGAGVNVAAAWALSRAERRSLNVEGARAHVLADLYGSIAVVAAGLAVVIGDVREADGAAALLVAGLMVRSGWRLVRSAGGVLLEASPAEMDTRAIGRAMAAQPGVAEVHDLHVWEVTSGFISLAAHVMVAPDDDCHLRRRETQAMLREQFGIRHTTLQVDHENRRSLLLALEDRRGEKRDT